MTVLTEEQGEEVHALKDELYDLVHDLVDTHLKFRHADEVVDAEVRQQMTESFRFWKR